MSASTPGTTAPSVRQLVLLSVPALLIGVLSAVVLWALDESADLLQHAVWDALPAALGVPDGSRWWTFVVLTVIGAAVGLVVWKVPGHAGQDSATTELVADPLPVSVLPSLVLAVLLSLAGGVSLGPENPIIAINVALSIAIVGRLWSKVPPALMMIVAASATIGALFGTPVAAALILTGMMATAPAAAGGGGALWDRLFVPLVAAGAGSITMRLLGAPSMSFGLPPYGTPHAFDLLAAAVIGTATAAIALPIAMALPAVHTFFHRLRNPLIYVTLGGMVLGLLGALGGEITLFKGLAQTGELLADADGWGTGTLVVFAVVKLAALLVAAASGFRGGRIFPAVFIGVTLGLLAHNLLPSLPLSLTVGCGVLGVTLTIARDGWVALFLAATITGDVTLLPVLCLAVLPAWLLVSRAPLMIVADPVPERWGPRSERLTSQG